MSLLKQVLQELVHLLVEPCEQVVGDDVCLVVNIQKVHYGLFVVVNKKTRVGLWDIHIVQYSIFLCFGQLFAKLIFYNLLAIFLMKLLPLCNMSGV